MLWYSMLMYFIKALYIKHVCLLVLIRSMVQISTCKWIALKKIFGSLTSYYWTKRTHTYTMNNVNFIDEYCYICYNMFSIVLNANASADRILHHQTCFIKYVCTFTVHEWMIKCLLLANAVMNNIKIKLIFFISKRASRFFHLH